MIDGIYTFPEGVTGVFVPRNRTPLVTYPNMCLVVHFLIDSKVVDSVGAALHEISRYCGYYKGGNPKGVTSKRSREWVSVALDPETPRGMGQVALSKLAPEFYTFYHVHNVSERQYEAFCLLVNMALNHFNVIKPAEKAKAFATEQLGLHEAVENLQEQLAP